jgi:2-oxoglutarate/2-oxoacid ferredoxin oxidoreductase subunit alpha
VLSRYGTVLVPELNLGQLTMLIRARYLVDAIAYTKVQGQPLFAEELESEILRVGGFE